MLTTRLYKVFYYINIAAYALDAFYQEKHLDLDENFHALCLP